MPSLLAILDTLYHNLGLQLQKPGYHFSIIDIIIALAELIALPATFGIRCHQRLVRYTMPLDLAVLLPVVASIYSFRHCSFKLHWLVQLYCQSFVHCNCHKHYGLAVHNSILHRCSCRYADYSRNCFNFLDNNHRFTGITPGKAPRLGHGQQHQLLPVLRIILIVAVLAVGNSLGYLLLPLYFELVG